MYKLIALDIDKTLLNNNNKISEQNRIAINKASKKGTKVVLATGRGITGVENYLKELNLSNKDNYCVTCNGSMVINAGTKESISEFLLNYNDFSYLYDLSKKLDIYIHALIPYKFITPEANKYTALEADLNNINYEEIDFNTLDKTKKIIKISFIGPEEKISKLMNSLPAEVYEKYTVVRSYAYFLEFMNKKATKGTGVQSLAKKLDIKQDEVICVGDAENDIHMINYAGLGVAMGNAFPEVKKCADYITYTNENSGVAHVIEKFILNS